MPYKLYEKSCMNKRQGGWFCFLVISSDSDVFQQYLLSRHFDVHFIGALRQNFYGEGEYFGGQPCN